MSVETQLASVVCWLILGVVAIAQEEGPVNEEFLEYLGMWEETDEEWLLHNDGMSADIDERNDPVPEGEESTESEDEC
jgi:hypothetical protein